MQDFCMTPNTVRPSCKAFARHPIFISLPHDTAAGRNLGPKAASPGRRCSPTLFLQMMPTSYSSSKHLLPHYARRGALLLALGAVGPAAWGQSFGPVSFYSAGSGSALDGVAVGDMNGDGRPDVVVANYGANGVGVLLGQAGGFAASSPLYPTGSNSVPSGIALGDVNGDGRLDAVTANKSTYSVGVLLGQAAGGFAAVSTYSTGPTTSPLAVALGDVNGDGRLDIVTAHYFDDEVGVLLGQASGGFAAVRAYPAGTGSRPSSVALGDVNGDGRLDIVITNRGTSSAGVSLGQAGGTFAAFATYALGAGSTPDDVALGDVNGDGRLDIVAVNTATRGVEILLGQASSFGPVVTYSTGSSSPQGVTLGDVTGDGRLDIVTANSSRTVGVLPGRAGGSFGPIVTYPIGTNATPADVALGDFNGDGRLDIATALFTFTANNVGVFFNTGTYTPLATARPAAAAEVTLAPNPAHNGFTVQLPAGFNPTQAELLNALGQVVRRPAVSGASSFRVETNGLAPGLYTLRLQADGAATLARRVVVE